MKALLVLMFIFCSCALNSQTSLDAVLKTYQKDAQQNMRVVVFVY